MEAAVTSTASSKPMESTTMWRFRPSTSLALSRPRCSPRGGGVDRLAVDTRRGPGLIGLLHRPDLTAEEVMNLVEGAVGPPLVEIPPDGALGREVHGEVSPLTAGAEDVKDGVEDVSHVGLAGSSAGIDGDVRLDQGPLIVGDVAGVVVRSHPTSTPLAPLVFPLWDRLSGGCQVAGRQARVAVTGEQALAASPAEVVSVA